MQIVQISAAVNIPAQLLSDVAECLGYTPMPEGEPSETDIAQMKVYLGERLAQNIKNEMNHYEEWLLKRFAENKKLEIANEFANVVSVATTNVTL